MARPRRNEVWPASGRLAYVKISGALVLLVAVFTLAVVLVCDFYNMGQDPSKPIGGDVTLGSRLTIDLQTRSLQVTSADGRTVQLHAWLGETLDRSAANRPTVTNHTERYVSIHWPVDRATLSVQLAECDGGIVRYELDWETDGAAALEDRLSMRLGHWYGGAETYQQKFALNGSDLPPAPFLTGALYDTQWGAKLEPYWLCSSKVAVHVAKEVPLWVGVGHNGSEVIALRAAYAESVYANLVSGERATRPPLKYSIYAAEDDAMALAAFQRALSAALFGRPTGTPDARMLTEPIWSTWVRFKKDINHTAVVDFAKEINANGFGGGQLEIDDMWQEKYGDLQFDERKFPDPSATVAELHALGFRVTVWTHPFVNVDSATFASAGNRRHYVNGTDGRTVFTQWWDGVAATVDFTDKQAADWFLARHETFRLGTGVDSFKFDAGEVRWLTAAFTLRHGYGPNAYSQKYAETCAGLGGLVEVREGVGGQRLPVFTRLLDMDSVWAGDNGLRALIPKVLTMAVIGYSFILPDMVGGNCYAAKKPDRELFVRWLQANVFLPAVQFSLAPWDYDKDTAEIAGQMMALRREWAGYLIECANETALNGAPMIRPTWWLTDSEEALALDQQFLLGDRLLAAPVTEQNCSRKSVFLPEGRWQFANGTDYYEGPKWVEVDAPLSVLPYFVKVS